MEKVNIFDQIESNRRKSVLLISMIFIFLVGFIYVISLILAPGTSVFFIVFAVVFVLLYVYSSYSYGDRIVLAATGAKPIDENDRRYTRLVDVVDGLCIAAGIPKPKIYVMNSNEINAYATGKDPKHASIAVTTGAVEKLNKNELEGVVGHELSHIRNFDIRFAMVVAVVVGLVAIISNMFLRSWRFSSRDEREDRGGALLILIGLVLAIIAPIVVRLVQLAISRKREYLADASSAQLTRYPEGLASALEKIKDENEGKMKVSEAVSHIFFADPNKSPLDELFATHPSIDKRIQILRAM
jgi:heat shock protein HtpX